MSGETLAVRQALRELVCQIEIGDFVDGIGHPAKMLRAFQDAKKLLAAEDGP